MEQAYDRGNRQGERPCASSAIDVRKSSHPKCALAFPDHAVGRGVTQLPRTNVYPPGEAANSRA